MHQNSNPFQLINSRTKVKLTVKIRQQATGKKTQGIKGGYKGGLGITNHLTIDRGTMANPLREGSQLLVLS